MLKEICLHRFNKREKKVVMVGQKKHFLNGLQILVKRNTNLENLFDKKLI